MLCYNVIQSNLDNTRYATEYHTEPYIDDVMLIRQDKLKAIIMLEGRESHSVVSDSLRPHGL